MTRLLAVCGGKGGVGKTTVVSNLAVSLSELNKSVIAIDANITTPNLGMHLGIPLYPTTLHDVLNGNARIRDAMYYHPSGFHVIPAGISFDLLGSTDIAGLTEVLNYLIGNTEFVLVDCAAGLGREAIGGIQSAEELLIVTNPELPAVADALKTIKVAQKTHVKPIGIVLNRVKNEEHELSFSDIEDLLELPIISVIPDDPEVARAISTRKPVVEFNPYSPAALEFRELAFKLVGGTPRRPGFFNRFFKLFG